MFQPNNERNLFLRNCAHPRQPCYFILHFQKSFFSVGKEFLAHNFLFTKVRDNPVNKLCSISQFPLNSQRTLLPKRESTQDLKKPTDIKIVYFIRLTKKATLLGLHPGQLHLKIRNYS